MNVYYDWQYTYFGNCFVPTYLTAISACPEYKNIPQYIIQASWSSPVTNKLLIEGGGDDHAAGLPRLPPRRRVGDAVLGHRSAGARRLSHDLGLVYRATAPTAATSSNFRGSASYVTGSHNIKAGFTLMHSWRYTTQEVNNSVALALRARQPFSLTQYATPIQFHETLNYNAGIYAQDQWRVKRLTMNYGVRLDMLKASVDEQVIESGPFTPQRNFGTIEQRAELEGHRPAVRHRLRPVRRRQDRHQDQHRPLRHRRVVHHRPRPEPDAVHREQRDPHLGGAGRSGLHRHLQPVRRLRPDQSGGEQQASWPGVVRTDQQPALRPGGHAHHELRSRASSKAGTCGRTTGNSRRASSASCFPRVSVYGGYTRRWFGNLFATRNLNVTNADFTHYCIPVPADDRLPTGGTQQCGLYDVNRVIAPNNLVFNSSQVGGIDDVYDGVDFDVNARLSARLILSGGVSVGRERVDTCNLVDDLCAHPDRNGAPERSAHGRVLQREPAVVATVEGAGGVYDAVGYRALGDVPEPLGSGTARAVSADQPIAGPSLGRPYTGVPPTVDLMPVGSLYGDRVYQTDLRFSKQIRYGSTSIRPTVSIYNLFNANPVQTYNNTYGATWLNPTVILQARFIDIGVQIDF